MTSDPIKFASTLFCAHAAKKHHIHRTYTAHAREAFHAHRAVPEQSKMMRGPRASARRPPAKVPRMAKAAKAFGHGACTREPARARACARATRWSSGSVQICLGERCSSAKGCVRECGKKTIWSRNEAKGLYSFAWRSLVCHGESVRNPSLRNLK